MNPATNTVKTGLERLVFQNIRNMPSDKLLLYLSAFVYVPSAILTPIVTHFQLKEGRLPDYERKLLVRNEVIRQCVSAAIHFTTFFAGVLAGGKLFAKSANRTLMQFIGGTIGTTLGHGIFRPILANGILLKWFMPKHGDDPGHPAFAGGDAVAHQRQTFSREEVLALFQALKKHPSLREPLGAAFKPISAPATFSAGNSSRYKTPIHSFQFR